jgi:hypothetical protein
LKIFAGSAKTVQPVTTPEPRILRIYIDVGESSRNVQGNRYLLFSMDYFTMWPEAYAVPKQGPSTVAEGLVANYFYRSGVPRELHNDQGRIFESCLIQEVVQHLRVSKIRTKLPLQSEGTNESHIKTVEEHIRKVFTSHGRD